ncbi:hypothetical protein, partial [Parasynechococcus sp.]|uniref:hypothetical protein n=1 Tax=Parasynechococcus sp. TaxID=3101203 RepID=UPI003704D028
ILFAVDLFSIIETIVDCNREIDGKSQKGNDENVNDGVTNQAAHNFFSGLTTLGNREGEIQR